MNLRVRGISCVRCFFDTSCAKHLRRVKPQTVIRLRHIPSIKHELRELNVSFVLYNVNYWLQDSLSRQHAGISTLPPPPQLRKVLLGYLALVDACPTSQLSTSGGGSLRARHQNCCYGHATRLIWMQQSLAVTGLSISLKSFLLWLTKVPR